MDKAHKRSQCESNRPSVAAYLKGQYQLDMKWRLGFICYQFHRRLCQFPVIYNWVYELFSGNKIDMKDIFILQGQ